MKHIIKIICLLILGANLCVRPGLCETKIVRDQAGRSVKIPVKPQRIIALAPSITEIIFALGQENLLKGVTQFSNYPPQAVQIPKVGSYVKLDLEKIIALKPDLCIGTKDGNPIAAVKRLEALSIPFYTVNPKNFDTVLSTIPAIGSLLNASHKAAALVETLKNRINQVRQCILKSKHRPGVFLQIGISPIVSCGSETFIHELITLAGGRNLTAGSAAFPRFSREQVITLRPDIIIITSMERGGVFERARAQWKDWPQMPAVRNGRIFIVDSDLVDRPSARLVTGLETLARLIHPELFENQ